MTNLEAVISPATEFHDAGLLIKRKILDVYLTGWFIYRGRFPFDKSIVPKRGLSGKSHLKITISAANINYYWQKISRDQLIIINSSSILSWCFESMKLQGLITDGLPSLSDWPSKTPTSFLEFVVKINLHIKCGYKLEEVNQIGWRHEGTLLCWIWRGAHKKYLIFLIFNVKMY